MSGSIKQKFSLINSSDYYNILHFKYLSSYTKYASTKSIKHFKKAITYIETIRDLEDNDRAASWESQLNDQQLNIKNPDQEFGYKLDNTNVILKGKTKKTAKFFFVLENVFEDLKSTNNISYCTA